MKRLFLAIAFLLISCQCFAGGVVMMGGGVPAAAAAFCSGCGTGATPVFCWGISADDTTITNSDGCSQGDTTATLVSAADIVSNPSGSGYALTIPGSYDTAAFDVTTDNIFNDEAGTIQFDVYIVTFVDSGVILRVIGEAATNELFIYIVFTDELRVYHEGNNAGQTFATTNTANLQANTWYTVTIKWTTANVDPNLSIEVAGMGTAGTSNTNLTAWTTAPATFYWGTRGSALTPAFYIKNIKVWDSWQ